MDEKRLRKLSGLNEATQSELLTHVVRVMKKLKFNIISAGQIEGGVVVVRTRASDFALDAKMSAILGKDKFFVAVTLSAKEAIFRFESDVNESTERVDEAVGTPADLIEAVHFLAGNTKSSSDQKIAIDLMKKNFKGREITNAVIVLETVIELFADEVED